MYLQFLQLTLFFFCFSAQALIYQTTILQNSASHQMVYLFHDYHTPYEEASRQQVADFLSVFNSLDHSKTELFVESLSCDSILKDQLKRFTHLLLQQNGNESNGFCAPCQQIIGIFKNQFRQWHEIATQENNQFLSRLQSEPELSFFIKTEMLRQINLYEWFNLIKESLYALWNIAPNDGFAHDQATFDTSRKILVSTRQLLTDLYEISSAANQKNIGQGLKTVHTLLQALDGMQEDFLRKHGSSDSSARLEYCKQELESCRSECSNEFSNKAAHGFGTYLARCYSQPLTDFLINYQLLNARNNFMINHLNAWLLHAICRADAGNCIIFAGSAHQDFIKDFLKKNNYAVLYESVVSATDGTYHGSVMNFSQYQKKNPGSQGIPCNQQEFMLLLADSRSLASRQAEQDELRKRVQQPECTIL